MGVLLAASNRASSVLSAEPAFPAAYCDCHSSMDVPWDLDALVASSLRDCSNNAYMNLCPRICDCSPNCRQVAVLVPR